MLEGGLTQLPQVLEQIEDMNKRIDMAGKLHVNSGGWRGLFDPYSSEWGNISIPEKIRLLREIILETRVSFREIVRLYKEYFQALGRHNVVDAVEDGLFEIFDHLLFGEKGGK